MPPTPGVITLRPIRAAQSSSLGSGLLEQAPALPGTLYVSVDLELLNGTAQPAPLAAPLFILETQGGLEYFGGAETAFHPRGCPQNASVSSGDSTRCVVVFSLPASAQASGIRYLTVDGRQAEVPVQAALCAPCGSECLDITGEDHENCGACGARVGLGRCEAGVPICDAGATRCGSSCVDLKRDDQHCGACHAAVGFDMKCVDGQRLCTEGGYGLSASKQVCGNVCVDLDDDQHCGNCDRACGAEGYCSAFCADAGCTSYVDHHCKMDSNTPTSCAALCGQLQCKLTEVSFDCPDGSILRGEGDCGFAPPATAKHPYGGAACAFHWQECLCQ